MPKEFRNSSGSTARTTEWSSQLIKLHLSLAMLRLTEYEDAANALDDALVTLERLVKDASISSTDD